MKKRWAEAKKKNRNRLQIGFSRYQGNPRPRPRSDARSKARRAAATSSTAIPSDLKIVTSPASGARRPPPTPVLRARPRCATHRSRLRGSGSRGRRLRRARRRASRRTTRARDERRVHFALIGPARADAADMRAVGDPPLCSTGSRDAVTSAMTSAPSTASCRCDRRNRHRDFAMHLVGKLAPMMALGLHTRTSSKRPHVANAPRGGCAPARRIRGSPAPRVRPRQVLRRDGRDRGRPRFGDVAAVHDRQQRARRAGRAARSSPGATAGRAAVRRRTP